MWHQFLTVYARFFVYPDHDRHVWSIHVCVKQTYSSSELSERNREIHGHRRFPDSTLTRADCNDVRNAGHRLLPFLLTGLWYLRFQSDLDSFHARQTENCFSSSFLQLGLSGRSWRVEHKAKCDG